MHTFSSMRIAVFAEFAGWAALDKLAASDNLQFPSRDAAPTKTVGDESAEDDMKRRNIKLFYTAEEEKSGAVDKVVKQLEAAGCSVSERRPFREFDVAEGKTERSYFGDRVILLGPQ